MSDDSSVELIDAMKRIFFGPASAVIESRDVVLNILRQPTIQRKLTAGALRKLADLIWLEHEEAGSKSE